MSIFPMSGFSDFDAYLYHYTSLHTAFDQILRTNRLMFNTLGKVNDPRENQCWGVRCTGPTIIAEDKLMHELNERKKHSKVLCMTRDIDKMSDKKATDLQKLENNFWRGFGHSRMWAQYADNHKGACMVFDKSLLTEAINAQLGHVQVYSGAMEYSNDLNRHARAFAFDFSRVTPNQMADLTINDIVSGHFHRMWKDIFFLKNEDWQSEAEWRFVFWNKSGAPDYVDFGKSLVAIVLGSAARQHPYLSVALSKELRAGIMCWDRGRPGVSETFIPQITQDVSRKTNDEVRA